MHDIQERSILFQQRKMNELETKQNSVPKTAHNESQGPKETYQLLQQENKALKEQLEAEEKSKKISEKQYRNDIEQFRAKLKTT